MKTELNTGKVVMSSDLFWAWFECVRMPQSEAYRMGVRALLRYWLREAERCTNPFIAGTAEAAEWTAGLAEGWDIISEYECDLSTAERPVAMRQVAHDVAQNNFPRG